MAPPQGEREMALLALSHTSAEHLLYLKMRESSGAAGGREEYFGVRRLMRLTGLTSSSSVRRACLGLAEKLSVETLEDAEAPHRTLYRAVEPADIFRRRSAAGRPLYPEGVADFRQSQIFGLIAGAVVGCGGMSRREAVVALLCAEGLSNASIGRRLGIDEKTVKFHLRRIFTKLEVSRRSELLGRLLRETQVAKA